MKKRLSQWIIIVGLGGLLACGTVGRDDKITVTIQNKTNLNRTAALVTIELSKILDEYQKPLPDSRRFAVLINDAEVASQEVDGDLIFTADFNPAEKKPVTIQCIPDSVAKKPYPQRAHAELSRKVGGYFKDHVYVGGEFETVVCEKVPPEHRDHSTYYRYEGPGWESDRVGYRLYLDQRNRTDIFGKKVSEMVLPQVGLDGLDSYHEMADWGADIFKVGESLGIGSIGTFYNGAVQQVYETDSIRFKVLSDGPVQAEIQLDYYGWQVGDRKFDLQSNLSIHAGSRLTRHEVYVSGGLENLVTGLVKTEGCTYTQGDAEVGSTWNYIALWGKQSLMGDNLGTALFFKNEDLIEITEDDLNHLVVLQPENGELEYYFAAAWENEKDGMKTQSAFANYLQQKVQELNNPIAVVY